MLCCFLCSEDSKKKAPSRGPALAFGCLNVDCDKHASGLQNVRMVALHAHNTSADHHHFRVACGVGRRMGHILAVGHRSVTKFPKGCRATLEAFIALTEDMRAEWR